MPVRALWHYDVIELGVPYEEVVRSLRRASEETGCPIRAFPGMSVVEVAEKAGISVPYAELVKSREYDELFEVLSARPAQITRLLERLHKIGLTWTCCGCFFHVHGRHDKARATDILARLFRRTSPGIRTVGLGEHADDVPLLAAVALPIFLATHTW